MIHIVVDIHITMSKEIRRQRYNGVSKSLAKVLFMGITLKEMY